MAKGEPISEQSLLDVGFERVPDRVESDRVVDRAFGPLQAAANRGDDEAREWATVIAAMKADPRWRAELARSAEVRLRKADRGPRTKPQEAEALKAVIARGLRRGDTFEAIAAVLAQRILYVWPLLRAMTTLDLPAAPWDEETVVRIRRSTGEAIARALYKAETKDVERLGRAALRVLGARPKNLWGYADQRARRRRG